MSDRVPPAPLEEQMDDVLAVLDAARCERPTVLAETEGTALACLFAATHPERVRSLALFAPIPRIVAAPDYPWAHDPVRRETFIERSLARLGRGRDARRHRAQRSRATPGCASGSGAWSGSRSARPRSSRRCA